MSDNDKSAVPEGGDRELDELLNEAIQDFDAPATEEKTIEEQPSESSTGECPWDDEFIAGAQKLIEQNMKSLFEGEALDPEEFEESLKKVAQETSKMISESATSPEFSSAIAETLRNLSENTDAFQQTWAHNHTRKIEKCTVNIFRAMVAELNNDLTSMLGNLNMESDGTPDVFPFMHSMMQSFISRDVVYPCIKELTDKYPAWLEDHRSTLSEVQLNNYEKQYRLMKKVCSEYESESDDDGKELKKKRFVKILSLMEEMQALGQPPQDLLGADNPLLSPDGASSSPLPGMEQCSII